MYYLDFIMLAKRYNKLFYYGFGRASFRDPYFWISCGCLIGMALSCYIQVAHSDIAGAYYWRTLLCLLTFELLFFLFYQIHILRNRAQKFISLGHEGDVDSDVAKIQWLDFELESRREGYLSLVTLIEALEARMEADRYNTKSLFEKYNSVVFWPKRFFSALAIAILAPISLFVIQAFLEKKEWTTFLQTWLSSNNISAALTITFGIFVLGSLAALALSLIKVLICYCVDVNNEKLCSQPSIDRLLYDLLRFAKIDMEPDATQSASAATT